jgi:hypothetical protein
MILAREMVLYLTVPALKEDREEPHHHLRAGILSLTPTEMRGY